MDPVTGAALISAGSSAASTVGGFMSEFFFGGLKELAARERMKLSNELSKDLYDYERSAEDPSNEALRYERAGLNKALMYESQNPGLSSSISSVATPSGGNFNNPGIPDLGRGIADALLKGAQIENLKQNTQKQKTETDFLADSKSAQLSILQSKALSAEYQADIDKIEAQWSAYHQLLDANLKSAKMREINHTIKELQSRITRNETLNEVDRSRANAYIQSQTALASYYESADELNKARVTTEGTKQGLNVAKTKTEGAQKELLEEKTLEKKFDNAFYKTTYMRPGENSISYAAKLTAFKLAYDTLSDEEKRTLLDLGILVSDEKPTAEERRKSFFLEKISTEEWKKILKDVANSE